MQPFPVTGQGRYQLDIAAFRQPLPPENHDVERSELALVVTEALADQPLDTVACHGGPGMLACDGQAEPGSTCVVRPREHREAVVDGAGGAAEDPVEIAAREQPGAFRKTGRRCRWRRRQTVSRARPLARRALITLRPPRVRMRARKPWSRFRFRLLGWKVRFISQAPWCRRRAPIGR